MLFVRLSWLNRWHDLVGPGRTDCTFMFMCLTWSLLGFHPHHYCLSKYATMAIAGVHLFWLHQWTISLARDEQAVRLYSCVLDFETVIWVWCSVKAIILLSFVATIHYNGDARRVFMLVESMERSRWYWMNRRYVNIPELDFFWSVTHSGSIQYEPVTSPHSLSQYTTMAIAGVRLCCLNRWHDIVGPGRKGGTRKFLCAWLWSCHTGSM